MAMIITPALLACALNVSPVTTRAVIQVESGGAPWVIHDDTTGRRWYPHSQAQAAAWARWLIDHGHSVDIGLLQVHFARSRFRDGVEVGATFEPCTNVRLGAVILHRDYVAAATKWTKPQWALVHALSAYNAGDFYRGIRNGYVAQYYGERAVRVRVAYADRPVRHSSVARVAGNNVIHALARPHYVTVASSVASGSIYRMKPTGFLIIQGRTAWPSMTRQSVHGWSS